MIYLFPSRCKSARSPQRRSAKLLASLLAALVFPAHLFAAAAGQQEVTRESQKTLSLPAGQSVSVEHKFGEVKLHGEPGREVRIFASIRAQASSQQEAESFAQKIQIDVQQSGFSERKIRLPAE